MNSSMDYTLITSTLRGYPKLLEIFGEIKTVKKLCVPVYKQDKELDYQYTIYGILNSQDYPDENVEKAREELRNTEDILTAISINTRLELLTFKKRILERLNHLCTKLSSLYSNAILKTGLENNVFSFLSELEFAEYCQLNNITILEIQPKLKTGKELDIKIEIDSIPVFVEVITPRLKKSLVEKQTGSFSISLELDNNIRYEFEHHEIEINKIKEPFILVIDGNYSGIDEINMKCAIKKFIENNKDKAKFLTGIYLKREDSYRYYKVNELKKIIDESLM